MRPTVSHIIYFKAVGQASTLPNSRIARAINHRPTLTVYTHISRAAIRFTPSIALRASITASLSTMSPAYSFRLTAGVTHQQPQQQPPPPPPPQQQQPQPRPSGHVSLKTTVYPRNGSDLPNSPRVAMENGTGSAGGYVPYSPYGLRRRDMISRPFSPGRPYSPSYRAYQQHSSGADNSHHDRLQHTNGKAEDNGSGNRSYSPYCQSLAEAEARPYSPYCGRRYEERDSSRERWQTAPRSISPFARDYSPWRRENVDPPVIQLPSSSSSSSSGSERYNAAIMQQRLGQIPTVPQTHHAQVQNIYASPMLSRKR